MKNQENDTFSLAHTTWKCQYHIVFTPKYHRKVIHGTLQTEIGKILRELCKRKGVEIIEAHAMPDYIHMLVSIPPNERVSSFMGYLKGKSTKIIFERYARLKYKYGNRHFWSRGYYVSTFTYTKEGDGLRTQYDGISVLLEREQEETGHQAVDFQSVLFGPDVSDSKIFNYGPAILTETVDGEEVMHVWYCTNKDDGVIMDHIGYRKGVKQEDGRWLFSEQQIVLAPTQGTWDSRHTCDPAVIRGKFRYQGTDYTYLMAYLDCMTEEQKKYEEMQEPSSIYWGTGMPALISLDGEGDVLMFYQSTLQGTGIQRWDFSDLDDPTCLFTTRITHNGIVNSVGQKCNINIPDFAYDPVGKRFYVYAA